MRVSPTRWRRKPAGIDVERNYVTVTLCIAYPTGTILPFRDCLSTISMIFITYNKSVFGLVPRLSTRHCLHLLCAVAPLLPGAGARRCRSISPAHTALSSKPAAHRCCCRSTGEMDGRSDARPFHRLCSAYYTRSVNN